MSAADVSTDEVGIIFIFRDAVGVIFVSRDADLENPSTWESRLFPGRRCLDRVRSLVLSGAKYIRIETLDDILGWEWSETVQP
ncbi:MAG: hypothetical protein ACLP1X_18650 [Polyangiaceae bacterium]